LQADLLTDPFLEWHVQLSSDSCSGCLLFVGSVLVSILWKNAVVAFFNLAPARSKAPHGSQNNGLTSLCWHRIHVMLQPVDLSNRLFAVARSLLRIKIPLHLASEDE